MKFIEWLISLFRVVLKSDAPIAVLEKLEPNDDAPKWFKIAQKELGQKEIRGGENKRILEYHAATTLRAKEDEIPWCASFVSWCLESAGVASTHSAWARSYLKWGKELKEPEYGCIVVFSRGKTSGHVAFYVSSTKDYITVLGGNQSDSVCISKYKKSDLLGYRWP